MAYEWTWTELSPASTFEQVWGIWCWDPEREECIYFGGQVGSTLFNQTWRLKNGEWTQLSPATSPIGRSRMTSVWDPVNKVVLMFGGRRGATYYNDLWAWNGTNWVQLIADGAAGSPSKRHYHRMATDIGRSEVVLFGGINSTGTYLNDTWVLDLNTYSWTQKTPATVPATRAKHGMAYDNNTNQVLMSFGLNSITNHSDTLTWDGSDWTDISPAVGDNVSNPNYWWFSGQNYFWCDAISAVVAIGPMGDVTLPYWNYQVFYWNINKWTSITTLNPQTHSSNEKDFVYAPNEEYIYGRGDVASDGDVDELWQLGPIPLPVSSSITTSFSLGHSINLNTIYTVGIPVAVNQWNQFDELATMWSLDRARAETNWELKRRILDAATNLVNSSYKGLINGVSRELGFSLQKTLCINPKLGKNNDFLAPDPYILFKGPYLYLYSDYANLELEYKLDRYKSGGNYEHLSSLVDFINTYSTYYTANLWRNVSPWDKSMTVINQSNRQKIRNEFIPTSTAFKLKHPFIVRGSLFFSDRTTFQEEQNWKGDVISAGKYYVDYVKGIVWSYSMPKLSTLARYEYITYPFCAISSPVILYDINTEEFLTKLFNQVLQDDNSYSNGLPSKLGVDLINELYSIIPLYWGT